MTPRTARTVADIGEQGLIDIFGVPGGALGSKLLVPNGDDAAAWFVDASLANVITVDSQVEGVHFDLKYTPPQLVGRKLVAVNLSDLAAMGARPRYMLLSVCIPSDYGVGLMQAIAHGIQEMCKTYGVTVIGGNTSLIRGPMVLDATVIGRARPDELVRRRGAQVGDAIYVTGSLGDAKAGLRRVQSSGVPSQDTSDYELFRALCDPLPRVEAGRKLAQNRLANAMCDVSDGFGKDLVSLLGPERLGARIDARALPISDALRSYARSEGVSPFEEALAGGEDYELLFTADPADERHIFEVCAAQGTPVCRVGDVSVNPDFEIIMPDGTVAALPAGFEHY